MLTHIDLFSGIGGFSLAAEWAGFKTIVFCEKDEYRQKELKKRFNGFIADSSGKRLHNKKNEQKMEGKEGGKFHAGESRGIPIIPEIRNFDGTKWRGATLLTGGFPCQPFSVAGKRRGKEDDRYLWPEMFRIIKEARPSWMLAENVTGITKMALDDVLADLEGESYSARPLIIPACSLNAPHKRNRVWIVGHSSKLGLPRIDRRRTGKKFADRYRHAHDSRIKESRRISNFRKEEISKIRQTNINASDTSIQRFPGICKKRFHESFLYAQRRSWEKDWIEVATCLCRMDDGIPHRVDRLKALGDAIVPQVAYEILKKIALMEMKLK